MVIVISLSNSDYITWQQNSQQREGGGRGGVNALGSLYVSQNHQNLTLTNCTVNTVDIGYSVRVGTTKKLTLQAIDTISDVTD